MPNNELILLLLNSNNLGMYAISSSIASSLLLSQLNVKNNVKKSVVEHLQ